MYIEEIDSGIECVGLERKLDQVAGGFGEHEASASRWQSLRKLAGIAGRSERFGDMYAEETDLRKNLVGSSESSTRPRMGWGCRNSGRTTDRLSLSLGLSTAERKEPHMLEYFDMHCHLGFCADAKQAARDLAAVGVGAFSNTVTPAEYKAQRVTLTDAENVRVGVGLHPWWIGEDARSVIELAESSAGGVRSAAAPSSAQNLDFDSLYEFVARNCFIGEIGLDFSARRVATHDAQLQVLGEVAAACARTGGKVLSVHAVHAVDDALDALESAGALAVDAGNACIIHWFSGTSDQLTRARRLGCYFSVNPRMLASKRGRAYAQAIPVEKLLLETDLPSAAGAPWDAAEVRQTLETLTADLAKLRHEDPAQLQEAVSRTSASLLQMPSH